MADDPAREIEIEVEVLPPGATTGARFASGGSESDRKASRTSKEPPPPSTVDDPFIALVSKLMDSAFVIPGTNIRFGLDPLIGLWPGIGDGAAALTSMLLLVKSVRYGLPKIVLGRMALNVILNGTVGALPVLGDAFSFWFKSNERNYELLRKHAANPGESTRHHWLFVLGLLAGTGTILALTVIGYVAMVATLLKILTYHPPPAGG